MSSSDKNSTIKSNVAQPIKIIERTVNPEVFRRKQVIKEDDKNFYMSCSIVPMDK